MIDFGGFDFKAYCVNGSSTCDVTTHVITMGCILRVVFRFVFLFTTVISRAHDRTLDKRNTDVSIPINTAIFCIISLQPFTLFIATHH